MEGKDWRAEGGRKGENWEGDVGMERGEEVWRIRKYDNRDIWIEDYLEQDTRRYNVDMALKGTGPL